MNIESEQSQETIKKYKRQRQIRNLIRQINYLDSNPELLTKLVLEIEGLTPHERIELYQDNMFIRHYIELSKDQRTTFFCGISAESREFLKEGLFQYAKGQEGRLFEDSPIILKVQDAFNDYHANAKYEDQDFSQLMIRELDNGISLRKFVTKG